MATKPDEIMNLEQLEREALHNGTLSQMVYDYYASGADSESTVADNRKSFARYRLLPRVLVDVSTLDTSTTILGMKLSFPVMVAPMAMQAMAHKDGECAVSRACKAAGTAMIVSTMANYGIDSVAEAAGSEHLWFQLYVFRDHDVVRALVKGAEAAGYRALVVTVDAPFLGNREADAWNHFALPAGLSLKNAEMVAAVAQRRNSLDASGGSGIENLFAKQIDDSLTWSLVAFLRSITSLPVIVKGILHPDDAVLAIRAGAAGLVVSNHGGRQLDTAVAPLDVLQAISAAVRGRVPILVDGGIRRGTDVLKALALGADAVLVGRPILYGLARRGQEGVERVLEILRGELSLAMALAGCPSVQMIGSRLVLHERELPLRAAL